MKRVWRWAVSMLLVAAMVLSLPAGTLPASAAGSLPTEVKECGTSGWMPEFLCVAFDEDDTNAQDWLNAMTTVTVNGTEYTHKETIGYFESVSKAWTIGSYTGAYGSYPALKISTDDMKYPVTIVVSATGYSEATITVTKQGYSYAAEIKENNPTPDPEPTEYTVTVSDTISNGTVTVDPDKAQEGDTIKVTASPAENYELDQITVTDGEGNSIDVSEDGAFTMPASDVTVSATFKETQAPDPEPTPDPTGKTITIDQISVSSDMFGQTWQFNVRDDDAYVGKITGIKVNDTAWEETSYLSSGGKYLLQSDENRIEFARMNFSFSGPDVIKSGDVITITADGYNDLTLKFVVNKDGSASVTEDDGQGDNYVLYVKLKGSFDSAITGQEYDAISGASTGVSLSKNSSVTVYGALVEKGTEPADSDWHELEAWQSSESGIDLDSTKCRAYVVADTDKGTTEDKNSGLEGVYLVISSDLTLSGTAQDPGNYLVYVEIADQQGRTATSNKLPIRVYSGEETLVDQMITSNMTQTADGKYMWDQEPWAIKNFGSNVDGKEESVRVLSGLKAWYGSHTSGTYGYLGYDLAWKEVEAGNIPQTLYIPSGCDLTLVNMEILSSVRIVIEDGGKLTLRDSVVQGIIDVEKGGTFSMNYDSYSGKFLTGASVCGQIRLQDGAILENAAIYSHANYLANGDLTDRTTTDPVVTTTGNVTIKGDVYIEGDNAGRDCGQTGLLVKDGTLTVGAGSNLVVFGGDGMNGWDGGTAIKLDNGTITGGGKLVAIGGKYMPVTGNGGDAVTGTGTISTEETFLRGASASLGLQPGKSIGSSNVKIDSDSVSIEDGVQYENNNPYADLYWNTGYDAQPPLSLYTTTPIQKYTVTVEDTEHGTVAADKSTAKAGDTITITVAPDDGYQLQSLTVTDAQGKEISTEQARTRAAQTSTFTMPASNVTVAATFVKTATKDDTDKGSDSGKDSGTSGSHKHSGSSGSSKSSGSAAVSTSTNTGTNVAAGTTAGTVVGMDAAAGVTANSADTQSGTNAGSTAAVNANGDHIIATGDDSHMMLWFTMMVISAAALVVTTKNMFHR